MEHRPFVYNDASLEAQRARAKALDLIAAWVGSSAIPLGPERNQFANEMIFKDVVAMEWDEMAQLIGALSSIGAILARSASQLVLALDELDVWADDFTEEHGYGDTVGYLRGIEEVIRAELSGADDET